MFRSSNGSAVLGLVGVLVAALGAAAWCTAENLAVGRAVSESRIVADMAETVGSWASQYGGVHARTQGAAAALPGSFLTRSMYAGADDDAVLLSGARAEQRQGEREAMARIETYYWKNPALIQREVADVLMATNSLAQYRMTARTVLNRSNAPNPFEIEALDALQKAFLSQGAPASVGYVPLGGGRLNLSPAPNEYWKIQGGQLHYARAVIAQKSCLRCHDTPENAPDFLRTNQQFNGGGGFGYKVGQPVGVISVKLPVQTGLQAASHNVPPLAWGALAVAVLAGLGVVVVAFRGRQDRVAPTP
jgi:hypothetical protein